MDPRAWKNKRTNLKILQNHPNTSSTLRKKRSIINKLRWMTAETFPQLLAELQSENFNKFHTEIVNNLLANAMVATPPTTVSLQAAHGVFEAIQRAVEVIYLFSFDGSFMNYLTGYTKKSYQESWGLSCILVEIFQLLQKTKTSRMESVVLSILKGLNEGRLGFILYVIEGFSDIRESVGQGISQVIGQGGSISQIGTKHDPGTANTKIDPNINIDKSIFIPFIQNELKSVKEGDLELLTVIASHLGITENPNVSKSYVEIIKIAPGEFSFYEEAVMPAEIKALPFTPSLLKGIERKSPPEYLLDYIGQNIYNHPDLIAKVLNKKKQIGFIPKLARILSRAIKGNRTACSNILGTNETEKDLLLIGECYKFGLFSDQEIIELINQKRNEISKVCIILESIGRYMLYKKETNIQMIRMIEEMRSGVMSGEERKQLNESVLGVLEKQKSKFGVYEFIQWYIENRRYKEGKIIEEIRRSRRMQLVIIGIWGMFKNEEGILEFIRAVNGDNIGLGGSASMRQGGSASTTASLSLECTTAQSSDQDEIITVNTSVNTFKKEPLGLFTPPCSSNFFSFFITAIPKIYNNNKGLTFCYANRLSLLARTHQDQIETMRSLSSLQISEPVKSRIMLSAMERFDSAVQKVFIKGLEGKVTDSETQAMIFSFCERHGHEYEIEEDSFEREIESMEGLE